MNVKLLKSLLVKLNNLREKTLPILDSIQLYPDYIKFTNLLMEVEVVSDNKATGILSFDEIKKIVSSLENDDDICFENNSEDTEKISIVVNDEVIGSIYSVASMSEFPNSFAEGKDFDQYLGEINAEMTEYWKEALDFVTDDELRPAMQHVNFCEQIQATDGHLLYFRNLKEPFNAFKKSEGYVEISSYDKKYYIDDNDNNLSIPNDWKKAIKGYFRPETSDNITLKIGKRESQFLLEIMKTGKVYGCTVEKKDPDYSEEIPQYYSREYFSYFVSHGIKVWMKANDDLFPNVKSVIPTREGRWHEEKQEYLSNEIEMKINKKTFIKWLKTALVFANPITYQIKLTIGDGELKMMAEDIDTAKEFSRSLECDTTRYELNEKLNYLKAIGFNGKYLMKAVQKCNGDDFTLWVFEPNKAGIIDDYILIMPIMLKENVYL